MVFLIILFLRQRDAEAPEPVKEGILVDGSKNGVAVNASDVSQNSGSHTDVTRKKVNAGKKVRVVG